MPLDFFSEELERDSEVFDVPDSCLGFELDELLLGEDLDSGLEFECLLESENLECFLSGTDWGLVEDFCEELEDDFDGDLVELSRFCPSSDFPAVPVVEMICISEKSN